MFLPGSSSAPLSLAIPKTTPQPLTLWQVYQFRWHSRTNTPSGNKKLLASPAAGGENVHRQHLPFQADNESGRGSRPVIALLALAALINYIDRGNLAIAAPL